MNRLGACMAARHHCGILLISMTLLPVYRGFAATEPTVQEWLTPAEIEKLRDEQGASKRTGLLLNAAKLRLETAESRLAGKSSAAGDPLEFYSHVELVSGCRSGLRAAMLNVQDQVSFKKLRGSELTKSLKQLKSSAESFLPRLKVLLKLAVERRDEPLYRVVKDCIQYADSAARGAEQALEKYKSDDSPGKNP